VVMFEGARESVAGIFVDFASQKGKVQTLPRTLPHLHVLARNAIGWTSSQLRGNSHSVHLRLERQDGYQTFIHSVTARLPDRAEHIRPPALLHCNQQPAKV
jgi:hypothetical protein